MSGTHTGKTDAPKRRTYEHNGKPCQTRSKKPVVTRMFDLRTNRKNVRASFRYFAHFWLLNRKFNPLNSLSMSFMPSMNAKCTFIMLQKEGGSNPPSPVFKTLTRLGVFPGPIPMDKVIAPGQAEAGVFAEASRRLTVKEHQILTYARVVF